jgi:YhcH/YjgK/YiaL family protein
MIYSTLLHAEQYEKLNPRFKILFDFIKTHDLLQLQTGKIELDGENVFINNTLSELVSAEDQLLEAHRRYIDVHFPLDDKEIIGILHIENCHQLKAPYDEVKDCVFFNDKPSNFICLLPGEFLIVFPEEAHAPLIGEGKIRKAVAKIKL